MEVFQCSAKSSKHVHSESFAVAKVVSFVDAKQDTTRNYFLDLHSEPIPRMVTPLSTDSYLFRPTKYQYSGQKLWRAFEHDDLKTVS